MLIHAGSALLSIIPSSGVRDGKFNKTSMKKILGVLGIALMLVTGCLGAIDVPNATDELKDRLDDLESRVDALEKRCDEINSNVAALQTIVNAMQTGDYVTNVEPVMENGVEVGYKITFAKASPIVIYHGKDGKDGEDGKDGQDTGTTPKIGIRQDTDGNWYWTLNGEWLFDESGNKVKAVGTDGKDGQNGSDGQDGTDGTNGTDGKDGQDGVTPQFRINEGYWEISYDKGATWTRLGKATGEDGKDGQDGEDGKDGASDSIFKSVYEKDGYVYFEMTSGAVYKIQAQAASGLDIIFSVEQGFGLMEDATTIIEYTIVGGDDNTLVRVLYSEDKVMVAAVKPESVTKGKLYVYVYDNEVDMDEPVDEDILGDSTNSDFYTPSLVILVSVSDGKGNSILKSLNFEYGVLQSITDAYLLDAEAGQMTATVKTNTSYKVDCTASWISYVQTKAIREDQLTFTYSANDSGKYRGAIVNLKNDLGQIIETFSIVQRSPETTGNIVFLDATVKTACVSRYDKDGDGELSYDEAAVVTDVKDLFKDIAAKVKSFDEFQYFISVTEIPEEFLLDARLLESIILPESLKKIGNYAFQNCVALKEIVIPEGVEGSDYYDASWFKGCENLTKVVLPSTLKILPTHGFENCSSLRTVNIPEGVKQIPISCFSNCSSLQSIELPSTLIYIRSDGFSGCSSLKSITLPEGFTFEDIDHHDAYSSSNAFANCTSLETFSMPKSLKRLPRYCFRGCASLKTIAVPEGVTYIGDYCFEGCSSLESVTLPSRLDSGLNPHTFASCVSLKSITIPEGVTAIPSSCFVNCISLSEVNLPQSVYEIQGEAFRNCKSLKSFDFSNITYLGEFDESYYCQSHFAYSGLKSVTFPASVNKIPGRMFEYCDSLSTVKLHENITHIGESAFRGTAISGDIVEGTEVKAFAIPSKVEYIGYDAFRECQNLENVILYPATPPNMEWPFDEHHMIYVPDASVEIYKGNYPSYSILPISTIGQDIECSIAEFTSAPKDNTKYRITGVVSEITDSQNGYFIIKDYSGYLNVSGLSGFEESGIKVDDIVVLSGKHAYDEYMTEASIKKVYPVTEVTPTEFLTKEDSEEVYYKLTGTITNIVNTKYGNCYVTDGESEVYVYGVYPGIYPAFKPSGETTQNFMSDAGIEVWDKISVIGYKKTYNGTVELFAGAYVSHEKGVAPEPDPDPSGYSIDLAYTLGSNAYDDGLATINGVENCKVLKIGTTSKQGSIDFDVPAGTVGVSFNCVAWNNYPTTMTVNIGGEVHEVEVPANSGATGTGSYTLTISASNSCTVDFGTSDFPDGTTITVSTKQGSPNRVLIYDVSAL